MPKTPPRKKSKTALIPWLERLTSRVGDNLADRVIEQLTTGLIAFLASLISVTQGWQPLFALSISLLLLSIASLILSLLHRHLRTSASSPRPSTTPRLDPAYTPAHRKIESYQMFVTFAPGHRPQDWEIHEHITCIGARGQLKNLPGTIHYKSGLKGLEIHPLNLGDKSGYIKIDPATITRLNDQQYNFLIELVPPLKPRHSRELAYEVVPLNPGVAPSYLFIASLGSENISRSLFEVKFAPTELPQDTKVTKVYWPRGVGEHGAGGIVVRNPDGTEAHQFVDTATRRARVSFTKSELDHLDREYRASPEQRCHGVSWTWPPKPSIPAPESPSKRFLKNLRLN